MSTVLVLPNIYATNVDKGEQQSYSDILYDIQTCKYATVNKSYRPVIMPVSTLFRPLQADQYYKFWQGFQLIDVDIKNEKAAYAVKTELVKLIGKLPWVISIQFSASAKSIHIYTDTSVEHLRHNDAIDYRTHFLSVYERKYIIVWKALVHIYETCTTLSDDEKREIHPVYNLGTRHKNRPEFANVLDVSMARISQPCIITHDPNVYVNKSYSSQLFDCSEDIDLVYKGSNERYMLDNLKNEFDRITGRKYANVDYDDIQQTQIDGIDDSDVVIIPSAYDNRQRFNLAYTLANLYDLRTPASGKFSHVENMFLQMLSGSNKFEKEQNSYRAILKSAANRRLAGTAPISWWAIKELRQIHGFKIQIANTEQNTNVEIIQQFNSDDEITKFIKNGCKIHDLFEIAITKRIHLNENEYIGTYMDEVLDNISIGVNWMIAAPGLGKTEFVKKLSQGDKRVLLVEPYRSIISSKIAESDIDMYCIYGDIKNDIVSVDNVCMTFDKFGNVDIDEVNMLYDYVVIDESHLLSSSSYRGNVTADVIDKCNKLNVKVIYMTGTPIAEHMFSKMQNVIHIDKTATRTKDLNFVICENSIDRLTKIALHITASIEAGRKILYPSNKGNEHIERVTGAVNAFLGRKPHFKYYKKEHAGHDFSMQINKAGTLGKTEILFCTNYLSVGIDINDTCEFDVLYDESFTAEEIEQFNCRLRKLSIHSWFYFDKQKSTGEIKNLTCYKELDFSITRLERLTFADVLALHQASANEHHMYDFFKWAFQQPYIIQDRHTNDVIVHATSYKLHEFEARWRVWSLQLNVVSENAKRLGYTISVVQDAVSMLKDVALAQEHAAVAVKEYRAHKQDMIAMLLSSIESDAYLQEILAIHDDCIIEADDFKLVNTGTKLKIKVASKRVFLEWQKMLRQLSKYYTWSSIDELIHAKCYNETNCTYSASKVMQVVKCLQLLGNARKDNLSKSNFEILSYIINNVFDKQKTCLIREDEFDSVIKKIVTLYVNANDITVRSSAFAERLFDKSVQLFATIAVHIAGDEWELIQLPKLDSSLSMSIIKINSTLAALFDDEESAKSRQLVYKVDELIFNDNDTTSIINAQHIHTNNTEEAKLDVATLEMYEEPIMVLDTSIKEVEDKATQNEYIDNFRFDDDTLNALRNLLNDDL